MNTLTLLQVVLAICNVETGYKNVINHHDGKSPSYGLCQVKIETAKRFDPKVTIKKLMNKKYNVEMAKTYLSHQVKRYHGNVKKAISAYNRGTFTHKNQLYVNKVLASYNNYGLLFNKE